MFSSGEVIFESLSTDNGVSIPDNYIISLNESGIDVSIIGKANDSLIYVYPKKPPLRNDEFYYTVFTNIISKVDVLDENKAVSSIIEEGTVMFYGRKFVDSNAEYYLILTCEMNTLTDVVTTLHSQLLITAVVAIIVAFFVSYIIAGKLSAPIDNMSAVANSWAKGDDSVQFTGADYQEINELAKALNFAKNEKSKAQLLQRDLLANVTHDLKTPLTMIKAYAEKIRDISGDNKQKRDRDTNVIIEEADRLALLVNDILNLSKLQSNVDALNKTTFNLSALIERVVYRFSEALNEQGFTLVKNIESNVYIQGDEGKIEEVLYNLIGNSVNYTGDDKTVKIYLTVSNNIATLEILDSGKGIEKDKIDGIWEKYLRYSETHHRANKGTGLGLSIVKTILDAHNVKYGVISKKNVGSNFFIKFKVEKIVDGTEVIENG